MPIGSRIVLALICCVASADAATAAGPDPSIPGGPAQADRPAGDPPRICRERRETVVVAAVDADASFRLADGRRLRLAAIGSFALLAPDRARRDAADSALARMLRERIGTGAGETTWIGPRPDRYGRRAARLTAGGESLAVAAARAGMAVAIPGPRPEPCVAAILPAVLAAEDEARRARRGLWSVHAVAHADDPAALAGRAGRFAIVEGRVASVGNREARTYLNFGGRWSEDVTVAISARDRGRFGGEAALAALAGRLVRFRGIVENRGGPAIELHDPAVLEVVDAAPPAGANPPETDAVRHDRP